MDTAQYSTDNQRTRSPKVWRWITAVLALLLVASTVAIGVMAVKLANGANGEDRTVTVSGEATVKATPDEYVFYPSYNFTNADKAAALKDLTAKSDEVTAGLKKLGVADSAIKTNSNGYEIPMYYSDSAAVSKTDATYSLQLTVTVGAKEMAQKVQDYLVSTSPSGGVSPQAGFSDAKRKELERTARDEATKDARSKADQQSKNLGFKVGRVQSVDDNGGFDGGTYISGRGVNEMAVADSAAGNNSLGLQPGENELSYSLTVVYQIK